MKKFLNALFFSLLFSGALNAQVDSVYTGTPEIKEKQKRKKERNDDWKEKVSYGGNLQLQFGTYTFIYLSPTIGFKPFEKLNVGVGLIYNYISINYGASYGKYAQSIYGTHTYARYFITDGIFLQGQYDRLFQPSIFAGKDNMQWVDYALVGGGFSQSIGKKAALTTSIMYNLTPNPLSIYPSRLVVQFGFMSTF